MSISCSFTDCWVNALHDDNIFGCDNNIFVIQGGVFVTWRQKDRDYSEELGLYGKQTIDTIDDDLFLVGDCRVRKTKDFNQNDNQCGKLSLLSIVCRIKIHTFLKVKTKINFKNIFVDRTLENYTNKKSSCSFGCFHMVFGGGGSKCFE